MTIVLKSAKITHFKEFYQKIFFLAGPVISRCVQKNQYDKIIHDFQTEVNVNVEQS